GSGGKRLLRLRLRAAEVEGGHYLNARIQRPGHRHRVAAARHAAEHRNSLRINARLLQEHIDAAHQVPYHPADQAFADQVQLHAFVVPEVIILPANAEWTGKRRSIDERMLPPFAVAGHVGNDDYAALPGPADAHVLQFALRFRVVVTMADDDAGHGVAVLLGQVAICGNHKPRPRFKDDILDDETVA